MAYGTVKRLKEGFGFIALDNGQDAFFLPTAMDRSAGVKFESLHVGQKVEVEVGEGRPGTDGPRAVKVRVV